MHGVCISHRVPRAWEQEGGSSRENSRHQNNSKRMARNMEERNIGTKMKSPKQDLTSDEDLTIILPEGHVIFTKKKFTNLI